MDHPAMEDLTGYAELAGADLTAALVKVNALPPDATPAQIGAVGASLVDAAKKMEDALRLRDVLPKRAIAMIERIVSDLNTPGWEIKSMQMARNPNAEAPPAEKQTLIQWLFQRKPAQQAQVLKGPSARQVALQQKYKEQIAVKKESFKSWLKVQKARIDKLKELPAKLNETVTTLLGPPESLEFQNT